MEDAEDAEDYRAHYGGRGGGPWARRLTVRGSFARGIAKTIFNCKTHRLCASLAGEGPRIFEVDDAAAWAKLNEFCKNVLLATGKTCWSGSVAASAVPARPLMPLGIGYGYF